MRRLKTRRTCFAYHGAFLTIRSAAGLAGKPDEEILAEPGDKFFKHLYHSIICIGALVAHRADGSHWTTEAGQARGIGSIGPNPLCSTIPPMPPMLQPVP